MNQHQRIRSWALSLLAVPALLLAAPAVVFAQAAPPKTPQPPAPATAAHQPDAHYCGGSRSFALIQSGVRE